MRFSERCFEEEPTHRCKIANFTYFWARAVFLPPKVALWKSPMKNEVISHSIKEEKFENQYTYHIGKCNGVFEEIWLFQSDLGASIAQNEKRKM